MERKKAMTTTWMISDAFRRAEATLSIVLLRLELAVQATPMPFRTSTMEDRRPKVVRVRPGWMGEQ